MNIVSSFGKGIGIKQKAVGEKNVRRRPRGARDLSRWLGFLDRRCQKSLLSWESSGRDAADPQKGLKIQGETKERCWEEEGKTKTSFALWVRRFASPSHWGQSSSGRIGKGSSQLAAGLSGDLSCSLERQVTVAQPGRDYAPQSGRLALAVWGCGMGGFL